MSVNIRPSAGSIPRVLAAGFGAALLFAAAVLNEPLVERRYRMGLTVAAPLENAPAVVVFSTVVLGGFRGLVADILWLRISYLQEEGRIFEIVQLADWVTKLEPRNTAIWAFHAWNMAYNISVLMFDERDRWRWVLRGIELLRDEGIRLNPGDPHLYRELGWLFQHKMSSPVDDAMPFYRARWAEIVERVLPEGRLDRARIASEPAYAVDIRDGLNLSPSLMARVDEEFGPLDWRVPASHALYWAYAGKQRARGKIPIEIYRMIYQALAATCAEGRFEWDSGEPHGHRLAPREEVIQRAIQAYSDALRALETGRADDGGNPTAMRRAVRVAYANFLGRLVRNFASDSRIEEAEAHYANLKALLPEIELPDAVLEYVERWSAPFLDEMLQ